MVRIWTHVVTVASPVLYHWAIALSHVWYVYREGITLWLPMVHAYVGIFVCYRLHRHNLDLLDNNNPAAVRRFGFDVPTCCGILPQKNTWMDNWIEFYCDKLEHQINMTKVSTAFLLSFFFRILRELWGGAVNLKLSCSRFDTRHSHFLIW